MPKAAYRSGRRDKRSRPRCDSNLGPLAPQSGALTTRPLRLAGTVYDMTQPVRTAGTLACARRREQFAYNAMHSTYGWLVSRVVSVLYSAQKVLGSNRSRDFRVAVLGKLLTPIVALFTKQRNW